MNVNGLNRKPYLSMFSRTSLAFVAAKMINVSVSIPDWSENRSRSELNKLNFGCVCTGTAPSYPVLTRAGFFPLFECRSRILRSCSGL
jgi:hypothetical protein